MGGIVFIFGAMIFIAEQGTVTEVENTTMPVEAQERVVVEDALERRIEARQSEEKDRIEAEAQAAYQNVLDSENERLRQEETAAYIAELEETITLESY